MSLALLVAGNTPLIVLPLWLGFVALSRTMGERAAAVFAALGACSLIADHALTGSDVLAALADVAAMAVVAVSGISLARTVGAAKKAEGESRELALSRERERIAAGLHDGVGHLLTATALSIDTVRTTVRAIAPLARSHTDLDAALGGLAARFRGTGLAVEVVGTAHDPLLKQHSPLALAFAQESLANVVRHSQASRARIEVGGDSISVADDGIGNTTAPSFGLTSLAERAGAAGCRVATEPHGGIGGGFKITLAMEKERSK